MSSGPAIRVRDLGKQYRIGATPDRYPTLRHALTGALSSPLRRLASVMRGQSAREASEVIWALKNVSFEIAAGHIVGVIGPNGAGKTTLLKVLSRITVPTRGRAEIRGRVGSLLEVGTGFHPELSGRENIYLNGAILGMRRAEIRRKFDQIVDFAEVAKFIDTPVKHYSSGMYVRLAFAVAAHLEPEILLVDEVLSVGDAAFQRKCLGKMDDVAAEGRTVLFVSHNMAAVQNLCSSCLLLEGGGLSLAGQSNEVIAAYLGRCPQDQDSLSFSDRQDRRGNGKVRFRRVRLLDNQGREVGLGRTGEDLRIVLCLDKQASRPEPVVIRLALSNVHGQRLFACLSRSSAEEPLRVGQRARVDCLIRRLPLLPGRYLVDLWCKVGEEVADALEGAFALEVAEGDFYGTGKLNPKDGGDMVVEHDWRVH